MNLLEKMMKEFREQIQMGHLMRELLTQKVAMEDVTDLKKGEVRNIQLMARMDKNLVIRI